MTRPQELVLRVESTDDATAAVVVPLDPAYSGFAGHFPGEPVLPGMCHVDLALRAAGASRGRSFELVAIERARFTATTPAGRELRIGLRFTARDGGAVGVRALHNVDGRTVAELDLVVVAGSAQGEGRKARAPRGGCG